MKKIQNIFVIILLSVVSLSAVPELGIRYLKLANSYREAGDFDKCEEYLTKGKKLFIGKAGWSYKYWTAVADEYYGYMYLDMSNAQANSVNKEYFTQLALESLTRAKSNYENLLSQKDGSQIPISRILSDLDMVSKKTASIGRTAFVGGDVLNYERLKLSEIPMGINPSIKNLSLAENKFRDFPSGLVNFQDLRYLNLSNNRIRTISPDIEQLRNLKWLNLSGNKLGDLPVTICNMKNLEELDLSNNKLKTLPACLCNLSGLKILNLKGNKLPYSEIANLVKCLPNTNIFIDEYKLVEGEENLEIID